MMAFYISTLPTENPAQRLSIHYLLDLKKNKINFMNLKYDPIPMTPIQRFTIILI